MAKRSCARELKSDSFGRLLRVRGPAVRLVELPVGAEGRHGPITKYTPEWARLVNEPVKACVTLERPRQSGHDIEGYVRINGKRHSAFTSGGVDDFVIVVRGLGRKP
jgi:hypothetical protein